MCRSHYCGGLTTIHLPVSDVVGCRPPSERNFSSCSSGNEKFPFAWASSVHHHARGIQESAHLEDFSVQGAGHNEHS